MQTKTLRFVISALLMLGFIGASCYSQPSHAATLAAAQTEAPRSYKLLFVGGIMPHSPLIKGTKGLTEKKEYDYARTFDSLGTRLSAADFTIGHLETPLGLPPYSFQPQHSAPAALAVTLKEVGFDVLTTASDHVADRSGRGIVSTLDVLDSLELQHTGSYRRQEHRSSQTPIVLSLEEDITVGLLAYTYGTRVVNVPRPTYVDLIDTAMIAQDIENARLSEVDYLIVQIDWGQDYQREPSPQQRALALWLHRQGVDAVIGNLPHGVQRSEWLTEGEHPTFVAYSLGSFTSNQLKPIAARASLLLSLELALGDNGALRIAPSYEYLFMNRYAPTGEAVCLLRPMPLDPDAPTPLVPAKEQADWQAARDYYRTISLDYQPQTYQLKTND